jgi:uncharacterized membrane protein YhhN
MPRRALAEHRPWLLASIVAAFAYYFVWNNPVGETWLIALKGSAVGLLAVYAMQRTIGLDGAILVIALALSAAGDMVLVLDFRAGGVLFVFAHLAALALYARNRRETTTPSQRLLALALLLAAPVISWLLTRDIAIAIYGGVIGVMVAAAWMSRFPRYRVGIGAVLFLVSDWLIFSRLGTFDLGILPDLLVWPLYYAGQLMIATGVVQTLRADRES